jgi:hypothetical protein
MPKSAAQKSFFQFVTEINQQPVPVEGSQVFSQAETTAGEKLVRQPKTKDDTRGDSQHPVLSRGKMQSHIDAIRREFAALYIDLDAQIAALAKIGRPQRCARTRCGI